MPTRFRFEGEKSSKWWICSFIVGVSTERSIIKIGFIALKKATPTPTEKASSFNNIDVHVSCIIVSNV